MITLFYVVVIVGAILIVTAKIDQTDIALTRKWASLPVTGANVYLESFKSSR